MSGTEENLNTPSGTENGEQSGIESAKIQELEHQISELRKEAAKYRTTAKSAATEKQTIEEQLNELKEQFAQTKKENQTVKRQSLLDKAGCIKSDLVANIIPDDCEDIQAWIDNYKKENEILFNVKKETKNHGGSYKPSGTTNISPTELMNSFIRQASGR